MGLIQNITGGLRRLFSNRFSSLIWATGNPEVYVEIDTENAISEGYLGNTAVYAIVNKDAEKFASIPRYVVRNDEDMEPIEGDLQKLLERPNEYQSQDAFFALARVYRVLCGECFIWLNRGDTDTLNDDGSFTPVSDEVHSMRPILEMYVLPTDLVKIVPDPNNVWGVLAYTLDVEGRNVPMRKADVIHWKNQNLNFDAVNRYHLRGVSPLSPGYKSLTQHNAATDASVRMHQRDGAKGIAYNESLNDLTPQQQSQIDGVIDRKLNNRDLKSSVVQLQGKWGYLDISSSIDMKLLEAQKFTWQELSFLFNVPYELFDPATTFANKEMAQKSWVSNTIIPACKQFDGELGRGLLKAFGLDKVGVIKSDFDELPEMQEDMKEKAAWLMTVWPLTPNQVLESLGYETRKEPEFDEPWVPATVSPLSQMNDELKMDDEGDL